MDSNYNNGRQHNMGLEPCPTVDDKKGKLEAVLDNRHARRRRDSLKKKAIKKMRKMGKIK
jgi:hypothetical protein